jgi:hypothetical protein
VSFLRRLFGQSQPKTIEIAATLLTPERDDAFLEVVGEGSYQDNLLRVSGGKTADGPAKPDHIAVLWPEPNNKHDRNAIAIKIDAYTVGYLAREVALEYQAVVRWADAHGRKVACNARLTGGWDRGGRDRGHFGVELNLGSPGECILDMLGEEVTVRTDHPWVGHLIAFTGDGQYLHRGVPLDRGAALMLTRRAGIDVHPRVTKKVTLLVDCDPRSVSGNERKANEYGIPVVDEGEFWTALGVDIIPV